MDTQDICPFLRQTRALLDVGLDYSLPIGLKANAMLCCHSLNIQQSTMQMTDEYKYLLHGSMWLSLHMSNLSPRCF